jgi:hypothetical protein
MNPGRARVGREDTLQSLISRWLRPQHPRGRAWLNLGCDRCFEVHPEDPYIKAWLGASDRGRFEAEVTSNSVKFRKKLAAV